MWCDILYRDILLVGDREKDMGTERIVFFFGDFNVTTSQRRSSPHTHTHSLTNTLTLSHTHMIGQQWLVGQVVPEEFFGFCKNFWTKKWSARIFWTARGSRNI